MEVPLSHTSSFKIDLQAAETILFKRGPKRNQSAVTLNLFSQIPFSADSSSIELSLLSLLNSVILYLLLYSMVGSFLLEKSVISLRNH